MLKVTEFDLKTGQTLTAYDPDGRNRRPKVRDIPHSYLEHWLQHHGLGDARLWTAKFYPGVQTSDQSQLERDGKVLVFANGAKGYFTDAKTAELLTRGDPAQDIAPLYGAGPEAAHNLTAYGSLLISDGSQSTVMTEPARPVRLWVVDDQSRSAGFASLSEHLGQESTAQQIEQVLDRLGDGTMLVSHQAMQALVQPEEEPGALNRSVVQFRAATPDLPGMLKGTLSESKWVKRLGVDVIAAQSCIKGDNGRLSTPGLHTLSQLWLNRKLEAQYNRQSVGAQLKGTIPDATAQELNPRSIEKAQQLSQMTGNAEQLAESYQQQQLTLGRAEEDWLSQIIEQDRYGVMLNGFPTVVDKLERFVRHEWMDLATRGLRVPSAMAQPHGQLRPWEVCNRALPAGAIVAYYRSPVPNVSAVALAINNPDAIRRTDREAYRKQGVAYLNPWTAGQIAITDFDGDVNGYFVGYQPTDSGLADWMRQQLKASERLDASEQYEAGRQLFSELISQLKQSPNSALIQPADYPKVVSEVIERTAPERKPLSVAKQPKLQHDWPSNETLAQATWRAWSLTAENPIGRVANAGMVLQSFAAECRYARSDEAKAALLHQISTHFQKQLRLVAEGKLKLPDNDSLMAKGFSAYELKPRFQALANANRELQTIQDPAQRQLRINYYLQAAHDLLLDIAQGPNAANLQTAVDAAKSARGIDEQLYRLALSLQYKPHQLRQHRNDPRVYTAGRPLPTNTDEPIGWMVETVNDLYQDQSLNRAHLNRADNVGMRFGLLMDGVEFSHDQLARAEQIATGYLGLMQQRSEAQRQQQRHPSASRQPTMTLTSPQTGRSLIVERLIDATTGHSTAVQDLWRTTGSTNWQVTVEPVQQRGRVAFVVKRALPQASLNRPPQLIGWVSEASAQQQNLAQFFQQRRSLVIPSPMVQLHPPRVLQNDADDLLERATRFLTETRAAIPVTEQAACAAAMWSLKLPTGERVRGRGGQNVEKRARLGMAVALQLFPEAVGRQLQQLPPLTLSGTRYREATPQPGVQELVTRPYQYLNKAGFVQQAVGVALSQSGQEAHLGFLGERSLPLPPGLKLRTEVKLDSTNSQQSSHQSIMIQIQELLDQKPAIQGNLVLTEPQYAPTYQELQDWWRAARRQPNGARLDELAQLGQQLVGLYRSTAAVQETPPPNYRHIELLLTADQKQQMDAELSFSAPMVRPYVATERQY